MGASGFLLKRTRPEELITAVHTVAGGASLLSPSVTRTVLDHMAEQRVTPGASDQRLEELTPREREVLEPITRGSSNSEIAEALVIEESRYRRWQPLFYPRGPPGRDRRRVTINLWERRSIELTMPGLC